MGAWRHRHGLADRTGRVSCGRYEARLPEPSDRGLEVAGQQMEVRQPGGEMCSRRVHLEEGVAAGLIVDIHSLRISAAKRECDSKPHDSLIELRRCWRVLGGGTKQPEAKTPPLLT